MIEIKSEPLKNKQFGYRKTRRGNQAYFLELDIKSAVEWWKEYRDKPEKLIENHPDYKQEICGVFKCIKSISLSDFIKLKEEVGFDSGYWLDYDLWLINQAFEDVTKTKRKAKGD